ncbi:Binding-protein-dependent transport system inner membrane component [Puniceibacterium sediminis]|uniref:Binding-protein-dependent transport system inner membrane component n=1 Tax=Puniceibacterium sediminis TaxID=1608407 RepID=A0A238ZUS1_9RHOB|nr:carbohydrate ABC transporter permease [Puniceibacterium sediminis]SNR87167.1 Binding-protein-dependent transport system inner membrane component [Puniceibacterium sediminis]
MQATPHLRMMLTSLTQENKLFTDGPSLVGATLENYIRLFAMVGFGANLLDSFVVAVGTVVADLTLAVPAAYAFSRFRFKGRRLLILPLFILMKNLGLVDTCAALIIANLTVAIPFSVWMMTSYIDSVPRSLDDAAMTDGCTRFGALLRVVLPLCTPGIIATGIYILITA